MRDTGFSISCGVTWGLLVKQRKRRNNLWGLCFSLSQSREFPTLGTKGCKRKILAQIKAEECPSFFQRVCFFPWTLTFWGLEDRRFTLLLCCIGLLSPYSRSKCPDLTWAQSSCFQSFPGACAVIACCTCP